MNESNPKAQGTPLNTVITKAWSDPAFKKHLLSDPAAALSAEGVAIPPGVAVKVVENTDKLVHLVLPVEREMSEAALAAAVGGISSVEDPTGGPREVTIDFHNFKI
jgi:hypothetical protein